MQCPQCGAGVQPGERFCRKCGTSLKGLTDTATAQPATSDAAAPPTGGTPTAAAASAATPTSSTPPPPPVGTPLPPPEVGTAAGAVTAEPTSGPTPVDPAPPAPPASDGPLIRPAIDSDEVRLQALASEAVAADDAATVELRPDDLTTPATPVWATDRVDAQPATDPAPTTPLGVVTATEPYGGTEEMPAVFDGAEDLGDHPVGREPFKLRMVLVLAVFAVGAAVLVAIADIVDVRTDRVVAGIDTGAFVLDDFGTNLAVAGYIAAGVMLAGGLFACVNLRWGAGLAGGGGLALAGWAVLVIGMAEIPISQAQALTRNPTELEPFQLTVTRDVGYWLLAAAGVVGLLAFIFSLSQSGRARRRGLNPWIAALGAITPLVLAAGPMIPVNGAEWQNNLGLEIPPGQIESTFPTIYFAGRLAQVGLLAFTGVIGFLLVRTYGLGLAAGGASVVLWMWVSSLGEIGDRPIGIAVANLFATDTEPHGVTSVGAGLLVVFLVVAAAVATARTDPPRR